MHRRKFCKTALAAGLTVALTGCDISPSGTKNQASSTINAITGAGNEVSIEVATEFVYRLPPFNPSVYGANLFYSFDQARDFLHFYAEFNETLPDEASVEPQFVFDDNRGPVLMVEVCYPGDHAAGEQVMAPLVAFGKRLSGKLGAVSYQQMQTSVDAMLAHGVLSCLKSGYLIELIEASIDTMVGNFEGDHLPFTWFQHLGGASARIAPDETAYPHRNVRFNYGIMAAWGDPAESDMRIAAVRRYYKALEPHMKGFYTNLNDDTEKKPGEISATTIRASLKSRTGTIRRTCSASTRTFSRLSDHARSSKSWPETAARAVPSQAYFKTARDRRRNRHVNSSAAAERPTTNPPQM